ncbi:hypothetical protein HanPI659440_Chr15g0585191 [Helianthus annuus]|nr:hypothetical protein HanPI659440_Chr15g0585191 [Helianthus annuus]
MIGFRAAAETTQQRRLQKLSRSSGCRNYPAAAGATGPSPRLVYDIKISMVNPLKLNMVCLFVERYREKKYLCCCW